MKVSFIALLILFPLYVRADFVVIGHPSSPVASLAAEDIRALFNGSMRDFPETDLRATVLDQPSRADVFRQFYDNVFKVSPQKIKRRRAAYLFSGHGLLPETLPGDDEVKRRVASDLNTIGYIDAARVDGSVKILYRFPP